MPGMMPGMQGGMGGQQMGMRPGGGARPGMMPGMMPGMQGGMMRPMMMGGKGMGGMGPPQQMMQQPRTDMTASNLANAPPGMQKQMLGEKIFPLIARLQPEMAGKIT